MHPLVVETFAFRPPPPPSSSVTLNFPIYSIPLQTCDRSIAASTSISFNRCKIVQPVQQDLLPRFDLLEFHRSHLPTLLLWIFTSLSILLHLFRSISFASLAG